MSRRKAVAEKIRRWREDPVLFVREVFSAEPDPQQADVLRSFPKNNRICMKASKGPGKTTTLSWCAWNFLVTRPHPKIAATSITADNLADNLWAEMAKWQARSDFLKEQYQWTKTRIFYKAEPENWFMSARTWSKTSDSMQQADTLAGLHADFLLFILDESGGIPSAVMAAAEAGLSTGIETKIMQAGNPTMLEGPLYEACTRERNLWYITEMTGDPDDPNRSPRVSVQWAREQIEKYGRDNPWVMVNVFGKFPPASINALLGVEEVKAAMKRKLTQDQFSYAQRRLGCDVARFGDDRTVLFMRQGKMSFPPTILRNQRTDEIAAQIAQLKIDHGIEMEYVDDTGGWGGGVIDQLLLARHSPVPVNFSGKAIDPRYLNKRAEMLFNMAEWVKAGGCLPDDPDLVRELTAITYTFNGGKFQVVDKDQIKKTLGFSPDLADALALTFAHPEMPAASAPGVFAAILSPRNQVEHEFDPFRDEAFV